MLSTGRGILVEATQATWLVGTRSENNWLYNYNLHGASNVFDGLQQRHTCRVRTPFALLPRLGPPIPSMVARISLGTAEETESAAQRWRRISMVDKICIFTSPPTRAFLQWAVGREMWPIICGLVSEEHEPVLA